MRIMCQGGLQIVGQSANRCTQCMSQNIKINTLQSFYEACFQDRFYDFLVSNVDRVKASCALGSGGCHCKMPGVKLWMDEWGN